MSGTRLFQDVSHELDEVEGTIAVEVFGFSLLQPSEFSGMKKDASHHVHLGRIVDICVFDPIHRHAWRRRRVGVIEVAQCEADHAFRAMAYCRASTSFSSFAISVSYFTRFGQSGRGFGAEFADTYGGL